MMLDGSRLLYVHSIERFLETGYTIVVANRDALTGLCGANDANLGAIEEFLGAPVVTRA